MGAPKLRSFLLSPLLLLLLAGCSSASAPTDREIDDLVRAGLAWPEVYDILDVRKTNGFRKQDNIYIADVEYGLQFKKSLFAAQKLLAREMERHHPLAGLLGGMFSGPALLIEFGQFDAGDRVTRAAKITFIKTEKGWQIDQVQPVPGRPLQNAPPGNPARLAADESRALDLHLSEAFGGSPPKWRTLAALCGMAVIRGHCGPGPQEKSWSSQAWYAHLEKRLHPKLDRVLLWQNDRASMISFVDRAGKLRLLFAAPSGRFDEVRIMLSSGRERKILQAEQVDEHVHIMDDDIGLVFDYAMGGPPRFAIDTGRENTKMLGYIDADDAFTQRRKFFAATGVLREQDRHPPPKTGADLAEEQRLIAQEAERNTVYAKLRPIHEKYRSAIVDVLTKHGLCGFGSPGVSPRTIACKDKKDDAVERRSGFSFGLDSADRKAGGIFGSSGIFGFSHEYPHAKSYGLRTFIFSNEPTRVTFASIGPAMWSFIRDYYAIFGVGEDLLRACLSP